MSGRVLEGELILQFDTGHYGRRWVIFLITNTSFDSAVNELAGLC